MRHKQERDISHLSRPIVIYDGHCRLCTYLVRRLREKTGDNVEYLPFQNAAVRKRFPKISRKQFEQAVQFIDLNGKVYKAGHAALRALAETGELGTKLLRFYKETSLFAWLVETLYHLTSKSRFSLGKLVPRTWAREQ